MPQLRLVNLQKNYSGGKEHGTDFSLSKIDFTVQQGEFFALLGPSGCGKTTLLKLIAGLLQPDRGDIYWGRDSILHVPTEKRGFGMVFQNSVLFPHMTVEENVAFGLKMKGMQKRERVERAGEMLRLVGLDGFGHRHPTELSGGQQQRVSLARAIAYSPEILLMDEPFSSLDPQLREEMQILIRKMHKDLGITILFVTHDRDEAFLLADRIGVMQDGSLLQIGPPIEVYRHPNSPEVALFLGARNVIRGELKQGVFYSGNFQVKTPFPHHDDQVKQGWIILRPEIFEMVSPEMNDDELGILQGKVADFYFQLGNYHIDIKIGFQHLHVILPGKQGNQIKLGDTIRFRYDLDQIQFLDQSF